MGASICLSSHAQTTNFIVNQFNSPSETNGWGNWYGSGFISVAYDPSDANNNSSSGSLKVITTNADQNLVFDGFNKFNISAVPVGTFSNLQFSIRYDINSAIRTNSNGSLDWGFVQVGCQSPGGGYGQDFYGSFTIPATNGLGQPNTNWTTVNIPLNAVSDNTLTNITDFILHVYHPGYGDQVMTGDTIYYLDNIQFIGAAAPNTNPPPVLTIQPAKPGLRIFAGNTITYGRDELATADQSQSWIGASGPVSYSFTLQDYNPNIAQVHLMLIPTSQAGPNNIYNNIYIDYNASNELWLVINPLAGTNQVTASLQWKTGLPGANPNHTDLVITNSTAVGTWTLTFTGPNTGTLTAPGASPAPFTLSDATIATDFANPLVAYFGLQPNTGAGVGAYIDYASMSVTGVSGVNENDDFTTDSVLNTSVWQDTGLDTVLVTTNTPYWINYTIPNFGYGLGVGETVFGSTNTPFGPFVLPEYYNGYSDGLTIPNTTSQGNVKTWVLVPATCLPTVDGQQYPPNGDGVRAGSAFFKLFNPPLAN